MGPNWSGGQVAKYDIYYNSTSNLFIKLFQDQDVETKALYRKTKNIRLKTSIKPQKTYTITTTKNKLQNIFKY